MIILICSLNSQALMIDLVILPYMHSVSLCEMKRYFSPKKRYYMHIYLYFRISVASYISAEK